MTSSKVLASVVRIAALSLAILLSFGLLALTAAGVAAWLQGTELTHAHNLFLGILCGLIALLFLAIFHLKRETLHLSFHNRQEFRDTIRAHFEELGYEAVMNGHDHLLLTPNFQALLIGGGIHVHLEKTAARITGPRVYLDMLRNRVRLQSHVEQVQKAVQEHRERQGGRLIKRVQISLRVPADQWLTIGHELVDRLARQGANLVCDVNILAHSESGFPEHVLEQDIRGLLQEKNLKADIHCEHLTPVANTREAP